MLVWSKARGDARRSEPDRACLPDNGRRVGPVFGAGRHSLSVLGGIYH
jgi:hypothetical protein